MKGSAADVLVKYLEQEGVEYLFGIPGGHLLPLYDAVYRAGTIKPVLSRHEVGAAFMAYGYAVTSGKIGVCCGTVGPGATNLVTGVAAAFMDSVPLLVLTAQVGTTAIGKGCLQEGAGHGRTINQVALFEKITKMSVLELRGKNLPRTLRRAFRTALSGRPGPAHIDLPADVQAEQIEAEVLPVMSYRPKSTGGIDPDQVRKSCDFLLSANKPALLLGFGASAAGQDGSLIALAERLQIPVATTLRAKGLFPEDHPLALGCVGLYGTRAANTYLRSGVDVLLAVGASFHEFTTHCWDPAFVPTKALIQVDIDPTELGKNYPVTVGVCADSAVFLRSLLVEIGDRQRTGRDGASISSLKIESEYFREAAMSSDAVPIKPQRLMKELREALPGNTVVFPDIGNTLTWTERCFAANPDGRVVALTGLAAMGSATAACVGGKIGSPDKTVVCLCGDGDFFMTGMEVATAVEHRVPVLWVILNNTRLGMVHDVQTVSYQGRHIASSFLKADFCGMAHSLGAYSERVEKPEEIKPAVSRALASNGPAVLEVIVDQEEMPPMKPRMLALRRSLGLPDPVKSLSWESVKALWSMRKE